MELDDLKQAWQQQTPKDTGVHNDKNIIDMVQNKSYGPLANLKEQFERNFFLIIIAYGVFIFDIIMNTPHWQKIYDDFPFFVWIASLITIISIVTLIWDYILIRKMQTTQEPLKNNIEHNLAFIDKSMKIQRWGGMLVLPLLFVMIEIIMHQHKNSNFKDWYNVPVYFRMLAYIACMALLYFWSRYLYKRKFGKHIDFMRDMLRKME
jgi:hypothetical protein